VIFYEKPIGALLSVYLGSVLTHTGVEHDPVSWSRSNRILQLKTGYGSEWISKKTQPDPIWISKLHWSLQ